MFNPKERALHIVTRTGAMLQKLPADMCDDKDVVSHAVANSGMALEYASPRLRADKEVALLAVKSVGMAIRFVNGDVIHDKDVIHAAIENDPAVYFRVFEPDLDTIKLTLSLRGSVLCNLAPWMKDDKELVLTAVTGSPDAIQYASQRLRDDDEIAMQAVSEDGLALKYLSVLQNHKAVVLKAVSTYYRAFRFASEELRRDPEVICKAMEMLRSMDSFDVDVDDVFLAYIPEDVLEEQVDRLVEIYGRIWNFLPRHYKKRADLARKALDTYGATLEYFPSTWRDDESFVLAAVCQDGLALEAASERLRDTKTVVMKALVSNGLALEHASYMLKADEEVVLQAVRNHPDALEFAHVFTHKIILQAVITAPRALKWCPLHLSEHPLVQYAAGLLHDGEAVSRQLKDTEERVLLSEVAALKGDEGLVAFLEHPDSDIGLLRKRQFEEAFC